MENQIFINQLINLTDKENVVSKISEMETQNVTLDKLHD